MKKVIDFIEENVNGRTLFTKELVYKLEDGALEGIYSDQISFSNLKWELMDNEKNCEKILVRYHCFVLN